ncbi:CSC1-like protein At1g32090 [Henckelia pumila]|uniref:CSC1-like protein At1g32090 n=1 Tax=Henckelia pumila TaxID=405737 RepID=UPI003C6E995A
MALGCTLSRIGYSFVLLKIFGPVAIVALLVLLPVNASGGTLFFLQRDLVVSNIDKLSISNIRPNSFKFTVDVQIFERACYLYMLAEKRHAVIEFQVLVRNVPNVSGRSISDNVESFFRRTHPDHYLCHQGVYDANKFAKLVRKRNRLQNRLDYNELKFERHPGKRPTTKRGCLGLWGERVDSIDFYKEQIKDFDRKMATKRQKILKDSKSVTPAAFVSFNSRWGASVCAQTQQSKNPTLWLANWATEPRDVYWKNLAIMFFSLSIRKLVISIAVFALVFFYMIPIAFVQSLPNLEGLERVAPFLWPVVECLQDASRMSVTVKNNLTKLEVNGVNLSTRM